MQGLAARDRMVFDSACGRGIPVAVSMAGGYGKNIQDTVAVHIQTIAIASCYIRPECAMKGVITTW